MSAETPPAVAGSVSDDIDAQSGVSSQKPVDTVVHSVCTFADGESTSTLEDDQASAVADDVLEPKERIRKRRVSPLPPPRDTAPQQCL